MCQDHWDRLRKALDDRGIGHFGAKNADDAKRTIITQLEGRDDECEFDPLMACWQMIYAEGMKRCGLELMQPNADGSEKCPICESQRQYGEWWINGPADAMLKEAKDKGLVS